MSGHDLLTSHLPPELCSKVFVFAIPGLQSLDNGPSKLALAAPFIISSVSATWRAIAHSTPQLWTVMPIDVKEGQSISRFLPDLVDEWLGHSGNVLSLSIFLRINKNSSTGPETAALSKSIIGAINRNSHRISHLQVSGSGLVLRDISFQQYGAPKLSTLQLEQFGYERICMCLQGSTKSQLSRLSIKNVQLADFLLAQTPNIQISDLPFDFSRLAHLDAIVVGVEDCIMLLRAAHAMTSCSLSRLIHSPSTPIYDPPSTLPIPHMALVDISLRNIEGWILACILHDFIFPSLKKFCLDLGWKSINQFLLDKIITHMQLSVPALESLELYGLMCLPIYYPLLSLLVSTVGSTLHHLDLYVDSGSASQGKLVQSILQPSVLPVLESFGMYVGSHMMWQWLHELDTLVHAASALAKSTTLESDVKRRSMSVTLCLCSHPIDRRTGTFFDIESRDGRAAMIPPHQVADMMELVVRRSHWDVGHNCDSDDEGGRVAVRLLVRYVDGVPSECPEDVTNEVLDALERFGASQT